MKSKTEQDKTEFQKDVEQEQKEQEQIIKNYTGEDELKSRPTF